MTEPLRGSRILQYTLAHIHRHHRHGCCGSAIALAAGAASTPVFGVVRKMTTASITNRLNWTAYKDLGVTPFQAAPAGPGAPPGAKRDSVVMGAPQPTLDTFFKKKPRMG